MMQQLYPQLEAVCRRFEELTTRLNQPETAADPAVFRRLMQEYHDAEPVVLPRVSSSSGSMQAKPSTTSVLPSRSKLPMMRRSQ